MFDPRNLDPTINGLRRDAAELRRRGALVRSSLDKLTFEGPRGDRYRARLDQRVRDYEARAKELEATAMQVVLLKREVESELALLKAIQQRFAQAVDGARKELGRVISSARSAVNGAQQIVRSGVDVGQAIGNVVTGDLEQARRELDQANGRLAAAQAELNKVDVLDGRHRHLPPGDPRWREADRDACRAGVRDFVYASPLR